MNLAGPEAPLPRTTNPRPPLKTTPVGPPGTVTVSACLRPSPEYSVLVLRPSFATHHGPSRLAARPHGLTRCASERSVTSTCLVKRSTRAPLAAAVAVRAKTTMASAPSLTSPRRDGRRPRSRRPAADEVPIPVEAVLRHALQRRVVDIDDPEPLRVAERPLEVVEQAPHEVALYGRALVDRTGDGVDVRLEIGGPLRVVHAAVVTADVAEGRAVLGHVDRTRLVVLGDSNQEPAEPVRINLPAHVRVLVLGDALHARTVVAGTDEEAEVIVDTQEVDRRRDRLQVTVLEERRELLVALEQV